MMRGTDGGLVIGDIWEKGGGCGDGGGGRRGRKEVDGGIWGGRGEEGWERTGGEGKRREEVGGGVWRKGPVDENHNTYAFIVYNRLGFD